jgi:hypothetical protein
MRWGLSRLLCWPHFPLRLKRMRRRFSRTSGSSRLKGKRSGEGYFAPDGKALIFQSEREPDNPFYRFTCWTSKPATPAPARAGKTTCGFFRPESDEVLFSSTHLDPNAPEAEGRIRFPRLGQREALLVGLRRADGHFAARRDGSNLRRITTASGYDAEASYSPDGQWIVFSSTRQAYDHELSAAERKQLETDPSFFAEIYIVRADADGSGVKRLTNVTGYDGGPFFSPDGERIVWRHFDTNGAIADVYTMALDGSDVRRVTDFGCMSWAPFFHPSGEYLCSPRTNWVCLRVVHRGRAR